MGATNCPETPRQKMISMMYLVYTALLALNVSVAILDGYELVQESLKSSIKVSEGNYKTLKNKFESLSAQNKDKTAKWMKISDDLAANADELYNYIATIKGTIISKVDGRQDILSMKPEMQDTITISAGGRGDLNIASEVGLNEAGQMGMGDQLKKKVEAFRDMATKIVAADTAKKNSINKAFSTDDKKTREGGKKTWVQNLFEDMPAIACLTMLTKLQNDIRNTQAEVSQYLIAQVDAGDFRVNKIQAIAIPKSAYVLRGGKYEAQIILAATDSTKPLDITLGGQKLGKDGKYTVGCGSVGEKKYSGVVTMTKPDGTVVPYNFSSSYTVGEPSATVSADLMNVFYAGFANPMSVSCPGVSANDLTVSVSNAACSKSAKGYIVKPSHPNCVAVVTVTAKIDGKSQVMGKKEFRVKKLPDPLAFLALKGRDFKGGKIRKADLLACDHIIAKLDDADLDVKYSVHGFEMKSFDSMGNTKILSSTSPNITEQMKQAMKSLSSGKSFYISQVRALGPDGVKRTLPPMEVVIQ